MNFIYYSEVEEIINSVVENSYATEFDRMEIFDMVGDMPRYLQSMLRDTLMLDTPKDVNELKELLRELRENFMR